MIRYSATREIGRFKSFDELYWNATGNQWIFPIDEATARIRLPEPVSFGKRASYTGPQGSTASDAEVVDETPGEISFRTTRSLNAYEGLTVAAAFPKGIVEDEFERQPLRRRPCRLWPAVARVREPDPALRILLTLPGARAGRNPRAGTVVPIFTPPDGLTPAAMRYVVDMGSDNRTFAAALVDMGVRGHVRMVEEDAGWLSGKKMRLERLEAAGQLPPEEEAALNCLCDQVNRS